MALLADVPPPAPMETRFIDMADLDDCAMPIDLGAARDLTWFAGLDLSTKLDVTALVLVAQDGSGTFNLLPFFWLPRDNLQDRSNQESAKYRLWSEKGLITLTECRGLRGPANALE